MLEKNFRLEDTKRVWEKEKFDMSEQSSNALHIEDF